jgi:hypothetical protein
MEDAANQSQRGGEAVELGFGTVAAGKAAIKISRQVLA